MGIDYDAQTPDSNLTPEELIFKNKQREKAQKMREAKLQKANSLLTIKGDFKTLPLGRYKLSS